MKTPLAAPRVVSFCLDWFGINASISSLNLVLFPDCVARCIVGVQNPDKVDCKAVAATLPRGQAQVTAVKGGQNVIDREHDTVSVIATAAVEAYLDIDPDDWTLSMRSDER